MTPTSIGRASFEMTVEEFLRACDQVLYSWTEIPLDAPSMPCVSVRLGDVPVTVAFSDSLSGSGVEYIIVEGEAARTRLGVGPGSTIGELIEAYGASWRTEYSEGEVWMEFTSMPGMVWSLDLRGVNHEVIQQLIEKTTSEQLLDNLRVRIVYLFRAAY